MTDQQIKELLSKMLYGINNKPLEFVLRYIIFTVAQNINWQSVYKLMLNQMPELRQK